MITILSLALRFLGTLVTLLAWGFLVMIAVVVTSITAPGTRHISEHKGIDSSP